MQGTQTIKYRLKYSKIASELKLNHVPQQKQLRLLYKFYFFFTFTSLLLPVYCLAKPSKPPTSTRISTGSTR